MFEPGGIFLCAPMGAMNAYGDLIRKAGLNVEVQHFIAAEDFGGDLEEDVACLKDLKCRLGIRYGFHAPFMGVNYFSRNRERAARSRALLAKSLDVAAELGAEFVVVHSLYVPRRRNPGYGPDWHAAAPPFFRSVVSEAKDHGLPVVIENMLETSPESLLRLLEEMPVPGTGVCFDAAHAGLAGGARPAEWVEALGAALRHMHLSDNNLVYDDHLPLGAGQIDLEAALSAAAGVSHGVTIGLECRLRPVENVTRSLEFIGRFVGRRA